MLHNNHLNNSMQSKATLESIVDGPLPFKAHMKLANNLGNSLISDQLAYSAESCTVLNPSLIDLEIPNSQDLERLLLPQLNDS